MYQCNHFYITILYVLLSDVNCGYYYQYFHLRENCTLIVRREWIFQSTRYDNKIIIEL